MLHHLAIEIAANRYYIYKKDVNVNKE